MSMNSFLIMCEDEGEFLESVKMVKKQGYFAPSEFAVLPEESAHDGLKMANLLMSGAVKFTNCNVSVSEVLGIQIKGEDVVHMYEKPPKEELK